MIICLEGINGAGKTTLARALTAEWAHTVGTRTRMIEPVQATLFGQHIRSGIMQETALDAVAEALAFASARLHAAQEIARLAAQSPDELIVLERWAGAVVAYGLVAGANPRLLTVLERHLMRQLRVDHTFLVDTPGVKADARLRGDEEVRNRFETRGPQYLDSVGQAYRSWAKSRGFPIMDGTPVDAAVEAKTILRNIGRS